MCSSSEAGKSRQHSVQDVRPGLADGDGAGLISTVVPGQEPSFGGVWAWTSRKGSDWLSGVGPVSNFGGGRPETQPQTDVESGSSK